VWAYWEKTCQYPMLPFKVCEHQMKLHSDSLRTDVYTAPKRSGYLGCARNCGYVEHRYA
jgi:hypothetical protein